MKVERVPNSITCDSGLRPGDRENTSLRHPSPFTLATWAAGDLWDGSGSDQSARIRWSLETGAKGHGPAHFKSRLAKWPKAPAHARAAGPAGERISPCEEA